MKKFAVSAFLGLVLSAIPVSMYACSDLITIGGNMHCVLTGSSTTPTGAEICYYRCTAVPAAEVPAQQNQN
jgi:hypothetical protein